MRPGPFENFVEYLNIAAGAILLARMFQQRLAGTYRFLVAYFLVDLAESLVVIACKAAGSDMWWAYTYMTGQGIKAILGIVLARDFFRMALAEHPALSRFGQKVMAVTFLAGCLISVLNLGFGDAFNGAPLMGRFLSFERSTELLLMALLLMMGAFLLWFPARTRRNVALCIAGFILYSFQRWAGLLVVALWPRNWLLQREVSTVMLSFSLALLTFWIIALRRDGEKIAATTSIVQNPSTVAHLTSQLEAINARLKTVAEDKAPVLD
jgi:hypothetical protein